MQQTNCVISHVLPKRCEPVHEVPAEHRSGLVSTVAGAAWLNYNLIKLQEGYQSAICIHTKFFDSIFKQDDIGHLPAIVHGRVNESHAVQLYVDKMQTDGRHVAVQECGLCLHQEYRFLGASPDRVVYDNSTVDSFGLLEVKCPYKPYTLNKTIQEVCDDALSCCALVDGQPCLKKTHAYYYQVQGQMTITGLHWCDFTVVWVGHEDLHVERLNFDPEMWDDAMLPKLLYPTSNTCMCLKRRDMRLYTYIH